MGVGETVRQALAEPASALRYGDLLRPAHALEKLESLRLSLQRAITGTGGIGDAALRPSAAQELSVLGDASLAGRWLAAAAPCLRQSPPASTDAIAARLARPGTVLFEGAQGVLLDEWRGFHPHTTWSTISTQAVEAVLRDLGIGAPVEHLGVLRSYLTRHGAGPLPTHDPRLDARLAEPHNADEGWQGAFRRGHPDALLLRYALDAVGPLDGLLVSHLDAIARVHLRWCTGYRTGDGAALASLPQGPAFDLAHQQALTRQLDAVRPVFEPHHIASAQAWVERAEALSGLPVRHGAFGPTRDAVRARAHI